MERSGGNRWRTPARPGPGKPRNERPTETGEDARQSTARNCHAGGRGFESRRSRLYLQGFRWRPRAAQFSHPALIPRQLRRDSFRCRSRRTCTASSLAFCLSALRLWRIAAATAPPATSPRRCIDRTPPRSGRRSRRPASTSAAPVRACGSKGALPGAGRLSLGVAPGPRGTPHHPMSLNSPHRAPAASTFTQCEPEHHQRPEDRKRL